MEVFYLWPNGWSTSLSLYAKAITILVLQLHHRVLAWRLDWVSASSNKKNSSHKGRTTAPSFAYTSSSLSIWLTRELLHKQNMRNPMQGSWFHTIRGFCSMHLTTGLDAKKSFLHLCSITAGRTLDLNWEQISSKAQELEYMKGSSSPLHQYGS